MTPTEIVLLGLLLFVLVLYITSKFGKNKSLNNIINEVKTDLTQTAGNVAELVTKAKDIVFDESVTMRIIILFIDQ